jgi:hypothetical protein
MDVTKTSTEAEMAPRKLDAEKALSVARRKAQTAADKIVYQLLNAAFTFQMVAVEDNKMFWNQSLPLATRQKYSDRMAAEWANSTQCDWEIRVALQDKLEELKQSN